MTSRPHAVQLRSYPPGRWGWECLTGGCGMWRGDLTSFDDARIDAETHANNTWGVT